LGIEEESPEFLFDVDTERSEIESTLWALLFLIVESVINFCFSATEKWVFFEEDERAESECSFKESRGDTWAFATKTRHMEKILLCHNVLRRSFEIICIAVWQQKYRYSN
jgi:hypothetical protein